MSGLGSTSQNLYGPKTEHVYQSELKLGSRPIYESERKICSRSNFIWVGTFGKSENRIPVRNPRSNLGLDKICRATIQA